MDTVSSGFQYVREWSEELINGYKVSLSVLRDADGELAEAKGKLTEQEAIVSQDAMTDGKTDTARKSLAAAAIAGDSACEIFRKAVETRQYTYNMAVDAVRLSEERLKNFRAIMRALGEE